MKKIFLTLFICSITLSCTAQDKVNFTPKALSDSFVNMEGKPVLFKEILEGLKGKTAVIDIWASWCRDCIVGLPNLKKLQNDYPDITYVFLSLDQNERAWKSGINRLRLKGEHYLVNKGWNSDFCKSIDLDWIPRYIVVGPDGTMKLFKATKSSDLSIIKALQ